uniref:26S proteasome non-ATPase regulatory subunit 4 homolog n=1 Tax=Erigeron canadensis TaxID=72917 RepID=UPI001CB93995|nr:26S proteasome non-ATPase regulatory subunit 4 homolog [Erigeron canadensis]
MAAADPEVTVILIDNSERVLMHSEIYEAQQEAIKFYCKTKFKCNPENNVGLMPMAKHHALMVSPTRDLSKILRFLDIDVCYMGEVEAIRGIHGACSILSKSPLHMKKRILMFVGGPINMHIGDEDEYGNYLKHQGVALDVVNFFLVDIAFACSSLLFGEYCYARRELGELVTIVNDNGNSHIVDVKDESSVIKILSDSILKDHLHYIEKKTAADAEASRIQFVKPESKNESAADDEYFQAPGTEYVKQYPAKKTPHIDSKIREDLSRCRIGKQGLDPSHNEKNQKPMLKQVLELSHNDKNRFKLLQNMLEE